MSVLFSSNTFSGENLDRTSYELDWNSTAVVEQVASKCNNTIVITHSVGVNTMPWANHHNVKGIIAAHLPGQESGNSIVDVLWGDVNPSGKLPYSIPVNANDLDIPIFNLTQEQVTSSDAWQADFDEGLLADYRRLDDLGISPLYEFGFGLSYTTFDVNDSLKVQLLSLNATARPDANRAVIPGGHPDLWDNIVKISATVTNTGSVLCATVAQLYVSHPKDTTPSGTPLQVLRGFEKINLEPDESRVVDFELTRRDLSYYSTGHDDWVLPRGNFTFRVGLSSRDIRAESSYVIRKGSSAC